MGYINPLLDLPSGRKLLTMPKEQRAPLEAVLRELRAQADAEAEKAWKKRKGPMAAYWRAVATYARHTAHARSKGAPIAPPEPPELPMAEVDWVAAQEQRTSVEPEPTFTSTTCHPGPTPMGLGH